MTVFALKLSTKNL